MRKQYWVSNEHNFKNTLVLYEDGKELYRGEIWVDDLLDKLNEIEDLGYEQGYLPTEVQAACRKYYRMLQSIIGEEIK